MRRPRLHIALGQDVLDALQAGADQHGVRITTLAGQIVTAALLGGQPAPPGQMALPAPSPAPAAPEPSPDAERAGWLELDRGRQWRDRTWEAAELLRAAYPDLAEHVGPGWTADRFTRDGLLALAVWREDLDAGTQTDPRLEHQWLAALRDFKRMLEERSGFRGAPVEPLQRPAEW